MDVVFACQVRVVAASRGHRHDDACTEIVLPDNHGRRHLDDGSRAYAPGDVFVYQAGTARWVENHDAGIHLCLGVVDPLARRLPEGVAAADDGVQVAAAALRHALRAIDEHHEARLRHAAGLLVLATAHVLPPADLHEADLALRARTIIDQQYAQVPGVGAVAQALGVSGEHLRQRFRAAYGTAPSAYLVERRLRAAQQMLGWGELPVGLIAERCGFSNPYHFSRQFRAHIGRSPSAERARIRSDREDDRS